MATYVAITTTNAQHGWSKVATGSNKKEVLAKAEQIICGDQMDQVKDIYTQTKMSNLKVVSKTVAKRTYGVDIDKVEMYW